MDLRKLNIKQLKKLQSDVEKAIQNYEQKARKEAVSELEAQAKKLGFSLSELVGDAKPTKISKPAKKAKSTKGIKVAPKYAHPQDKSLTWTGRGKKPKWVEEQLSNGQTLDSLAI